MFSGWARMENVRVGQWNRMEKWEIEKGEKKEEQEILLSAVVVVFDFAQPEKVLNFELIRESVHRGVRTNLKWKWKYKNFD